MNRIDLSMIQPNPSKILTTEQEEDNFSKNGEESREESVRSPKSFLMGQGSHSRKFTIFKELQRMKTTRSEESLGGNRNKIQFKIPSIEDYYIKQSRENINPNKIHRMESMIYNNNKKEDRPSHTQKPPTHFQISNPPRQQAYLHLIIAVLVLVVLGLGVRWGEGSVWKFV